LVVGHWTISGVELDLGSAFYAKAEELARFLHDFYDAEDGVNRDVFAGEVNDFLFTHARTSVSGEDEVADFIHGRAIDVAGTGFEDVGH